MQTEFKMKETSFNLIDFFNFQSVGEYNKDTQFHPIEQAMIIWKSHVVSIEKKMQALNELLELYTEEEFQYGYNGKDTYGVRAFSYKQLLKHTVDACQAALDRRNQKVDGLIYKEKFYENNFYDTSKSYYFTDFQSAEKDLLEEMASYKQDFPGTLFGGEIRSISLTERELGRQEKDTYIYNSKGELAEVFLIHMRTSKRKNMMILNIIWILYVFGFLFHLRKVISFVTRVLGRKKYRMVYVHIQQTYMTKYICVF